MVSPEHPLIQLLELVDLVWIEPEITQRGPGAPKTYSEQVMFKVYIVSLCKKLFARRGLWRYLSANASVAGACGLHQIPDRRTLDRRLAEIASQAEKQIRTLGLILSVEDVTDGTTAASDGSAFAASGPVWHQADQEAGRIPEGLTGLDTEADWIYSPYHGWVYGYKAHVTTTVAPTTVRIVLEATVTGNACESHILTDRIPYLPATVQTLLLDASYDDGKLIEQCEAHDIEVLVPLAKPIGVSTSQKRRDRAAYLATPEGKSRYQQRGSSIEPFFATIKSLFGLDPLPIKGKAKTSAFILLALYAWNLVVLFNFINNRPLGRVKPILDVL
jgi:hypothetical protein